MWDLLTLKDTYDKKKQDEQSMAINH